MSFYPISPQIPKQPPQRPLNHFHPDAILWNPLQFSLPPSWMSPGHWPLGCWCEAQGFSSGTTCDSTGKQAVCCSLGLKLLSKPAWVLVASLDCSLPILRHHGHVMTICDSTKWLGKMHKTGKWQNLSETPGRAGKGWHKRNEHLCTAARVVIAAYRLAPPSCQGVALHPEDKKTEAQRLKHVHPEALLAGLPNQASLVYFQTCSLPFCCQCIYSAFAGANLQFVVRSYWWARSLLLLQNGQENKAVMLGGRREEWRAERKEETAMKITKDWIRAKAFKFLMKCRKKKTGLLRCEFSREEFPGSHNPIKKQRKAKGNPRYPYFPLPQVAPRFLPFVILTQLFVLLRVTSLGPSCCPWTGSKSDFLPHSLRSSPPAIKLSKVFMSAVSSHPILIPRTHAGQDEVVQRELEWPRELLMMPHAVRYQPSLVPRSCSFLLLVRCLGVSWCMK